jgi:hypothetical protein
MSIYDRIPPLSVELSAKQVKRWLDGQEAVPKSAEEIARMSWAEKLDYARSFDQSQMPAWRDPRANKGDEHGGK